MIRKSLPDVFWLMALAAYILVGTPGVPFHGDEATLIYMSRDYAYQFIERDLDRIYYQDKPSSPTEQHLRLLNGTVSKYLFGLAWHLNGYSRADLNEQWDWGADWDYNQRSGHIPTAGLLQVARWPAVLLLVAGMIVIFTVGWQLGHRPTAYLASLYYTLNPTLLLNGRRAMMESSLIFFALLVLLAGIWFLQHYSWRTVLLLGLSGGLALAGKHTTVFTLIAVFGGCLVYTIGTRFYPPAASNRITLTRLAKLTAAGLLTLLVFYGLNPAWWGDPFSRVGTALELRENLLETQVAVFGGYADAGDQAAGFARQALINLPQYYETAGWQEPLADAIRAYEASPWRGVSVGGSVPGGVMLALVSLVGGWFLLRDVTIPPPVRWLVGVWALAMILTTLVLTPLEWQRYYLPVYPALGLLAALGFTRIIGNLKPLWSTG